ncbi:MAG TPA: glycosyltransferase family 4 protein [Tepidisphaeraceae bacterium]|jgi:glycosyltransferase involved in cell wall biosynthesis|nr:glycosyltransferase family 4 protein [Tepidisphaeraceae bacterium]
MSQPTLCMIHEAISNDSAIARVALAQVRIALEGGYRVSVVAKLLDPTLEGHVAWLKLAVPPRGFLLKWATAGHFIRSALGGRRFDVVHAHQPQAASISDVFTCHFLTRIAYERNCLETRSGFRPRMVRVQQQGVLYAEDFCYRKWNPATRMLFCSELLRQEFQRLYGVPLRQEVMVNSCPSPNFASAEERSAARKKLLGLDVQGSVVGYLGGLDERKGYKRLIAALAKEPDCFLLIGGPHTDRFDIPALRGRFKAVGLVYDTSTFYAACDVLAAPSHFDPCPLVVFEAAARGVPVIATDGVGNLNELTHYSAGAAWDACVPIGAIVRDLVVRREDYRRGMSRMLSELSQKRYARRLLEVYRGVSTANSLSPILGRQDGIESRA